MQKPDTTMSWQTIITEPNQAPAAFTHYGTSKKLHKCHLYWPWGEKATTLRKYWTYIWVISSLNSSTALHSVVLPKREAFCRTVPGIQNSPHFFKPVSNGGTSLRTFRVVFSGSFTGRSCVIHWGLHWTKQPVIISGCSWWQLSVFTLGEKKSPARAIGSYF